MTKTKLFGSAFLVLALAGAGCDKPVDLGRLQDETLSVLKLHANEAEQLQRRADAIATRARSAGGDASILADASTAGFAALRSQLQSAPQTLAAAVKSGDPEQVQRTSDEVLEKLDTQEIAIRGNLAAVDNRLGTLEARTSAVATAVRPVPPPADTAPPIAPAPPAPAPAPTHD